MDLLAAETQRKIYGIYLKFSIDTLFLIRGWFLRSRVLEPQKIKNFWEP